MPRSSPARPRAARSWIPRRLWLGLIGGLLLTLLVGLALASVYLLRLDAEVRERFAGVRWALPAQVYASPLELYPGVRHDAGSLRRELERLGYRVQDRLEGPGTFMVSREQLRVHSRAFQFWDGPQPEMRLAVQLDGREVAAIQDLDSQQSRDLVRLDPMLIGSIYPQQGEDRVLVKLAEVPPLLREGLIAVEDQGFYRHHGISLRGILRASVANLRAGRIVQGASTITQQLVRNFFLTLDVTWSRKIREMLMAILLELHASKDQILEAYLNEIFLGQDGNRAVHGMGLASLYYFNKPLAELQTQEIAMLVGIVKGASYYNPRRSPERVKQRRDVVLKVFLDQGLIDAEAYTQAVAQPLGLAGSKRGGVERYPAFVELVKRQLRGQYAEADLTSEGLRIFTTLDPAAQEALERTVTEGLPDLETARKKTVGSLQAAGVITNINNGEVQAVVGGRDVRFDGFNRALDARRSIGSLSKPFVYLAALSQPDRYHLHSFIEDEPISLRLPNRQVWEPKNYDKQLHGPQPLYLALAQSYNLPTVRVGLELGEARFLEVLRAAGYTGDAQPLPSLFLGAVDIAPIEVAQMYATLAAGGYTSPLSAIREVTTKEGEPLNRFPIRVRQALPEGPVYLTTWAMTQVMQLGTGRGAYSVLPPDALLAGKTGTTDDLRDSWFAGFGADRVAVIWMGRDDYKPMGFTGSSGALVLWARLMRDLNARSLDLIPPPDIEEQLVDTFTGLRADEGCTSVRLLPFLRGHAPLDYAPCANAAQSQPLQWLRDIFE